MIEGCYIHIPFCDKICTYCDFAKIFYKTANRIAYLEALEAEYQLYQENHDFSAVKTVYFGGGTPSALNVEELAMLLEIFAPIITKADEITFEANPESLSLEKLLMLQQYGVNRISMGVQTFDEQQLAFLGRNHSPVNVFSAVEAIKKAGIQNYNVDIIYALPKQTLSDLKRDVELLLDLEPTHISAYALIVEPHTALYLQVEDETVAEVDETIQAQMYDYLRIILAENGYLQYETSNWAKAPAYMSQHNSSYWTGKEYVGLGLGSHGYIQQKRYGNTRAITKYLNVLQTKQLPIATEIDITIEAQMEEMIFLGLRLIAGVSKADFFERFNKDIHEIFGSTIEKHVKNENLVETETHIRLTEKAVFISNDVLSDFLLEEV